MNTSPDLPDAYLPEADLAGADPSAPGDGAPATGDPHVDAVLAALRELPATPSDGHVGVYEQVHRGLQEALAGVDSPAPAQGPNPTPRSD